MKKNGFTLIETIVVISITSIVAIGAGTLAYWGISLWNITQAHISAQENARAAIQDTASEIREMQIADNGAYPIVSVDDFKLIFYANVDDDSDREQVRYELINKTLYRGVTDSTSDIPPQYNPGTDEVVTKIAEDIVNTSYIFQYYDDTYNGETNPLPEPIELNDVRLIKIYLLVDYDPTKTPDPLELETNISLRNLKDNL